MRIGLALGVDIGVPLEPKEAQQLARVYAVRRASSASSVPWVSLKYACLVADS
jgi:hypothetical protein